jgi:hypothetical protein
MDRCASVNRAVLIAVCGLFIATPIWAEPQEDPLQDVQFREDQSQIARPKHKPKPVVHRVDPAVQLRHNLRDKINSGLVSIVSEGTSTLGRNKRNDSIATKSARSTSDDTAGHVT